MTSRCAGKIGLRAARIWRPETMLLITKLYTILETPPPDHPALSKAGPDIRYQMVHAGWRA
jgi:hypothetical protein